MRNRVYQASIGRGSPGPMPVGNLSFADVKVDRDSQDSALDDVLRHFDVSASTLLGSGGEAQVYALGTDRVLRVHRAPTKSAGVEWRTELLAELAHSADRVPFAIPEVQEVAKVGSRWITWMSFRATSSWRARRCWR